MKELGSEDGATTGLTDEKIFAAKFAAFVQELSFPCLGAKAAFNAESYLVKAYDTLASEDGTRLLARDLQEFTTSEMRRTSAYATFLAVFREPSQTSEADFEQLLWRQLQLLHNADCPVAYHWDPAVSWDAEDPRFSFSFGGQALYVVGMHAQSSRLSRQFPWPTLVFNPHEQFERLRHDGKWRRMQETIRQRDIALQGEVNPMLSDFGESSEARQYSGRAVEENWHPPFEPKRESEPPRCPFAPPQ